MWSHAPSNVGVIDFRCRNFSKHISEFQIDFITIIKFLILFSKLYRDTMKLLFEAENFLAAAGDNLVDSLYGKIYCDEFSRKIFY